MTDMQIAAIVEAANKVETLGIVGVMFLMLIAALIGNFLLFRNAIKNCEHSGEIRDSIKELKAEMEKSNALQENNIEMMKNFLEMFLRERWK